MCSTRSISTTPATALADISYQFRFTTVNNIPSSFLYNDGPITSLTPPSPSSPWNRQQTYSLTRVDHNPRNRWGGSTTVLGSGLLCPPCNIGPLSTPELRRRLAGRRRPPCPGRPVLGHGVRRAAGRRLLRRPRRGVRPRRPAPLRRRPRRRPGRRAHERHARRELHRRRQRALPRPAGPDRASSPGPRPGGRSDPAAVIGVWTTASRQRVRVATATESGEPFWSGPVDPGVPPGQPAGQRADHRHRRQGPLEPTQPLADGRHQFLHYFAQPLLATAAAQPVPRRVPQPGRLQRHSASHPTRHRGHLAHRHPGRGDPPAPPSPTTTAPASKPTSCGSTPRSRRRRRPNSLGLLGLDVAGYPNGRRVFDDVATIALRAVAGATLRLRRSRLHAPTRPPGPWTSV